MNFIYIFKFTIFRKNSELANRLPEHLFWHKPSFLRINHTIYQFSVSLIHANHDFHCQLEQVAFKTSPKHLQYPILSSSTFIYHSAISDSNFQIHLTSQHLFTFYTDKRSNTCLPGNLFTSNQHKCSSLISSY